MEYKVNSMRINKNQKWNNSIRIVNWKKIDFLVSIWWQRKINRKKWNKIDILKFEWKAKTILEAIKGRISYLLIFVNKMFLFLQYKHDFFKFNGSNQAEYLIFD